MTNADISTLLRQVAASLIIKDEKRFRFQIVAYQRASDSIESTSDEIKDLIREHKLDSVPGIGTSMKQHLEELINTGHVKHFDAILKETPQAIFPLIKIPSIGPKKAFKLVTNFNLDNPKTVIDDVEKLAKEDKISSLPTFGAKSQSDILRAISEYRMGTGKTTRMVLPFAGEVADKIIEYMKKSKAVVKISPLGSLRRMKSTIGDVDLAVATHDSKAVIKHFVSYPYIHRMIEQGENTASMLVSGGRQVDLMTQPVEGFGALLQHFTGSKHHNVHLRDIAIRKGLSLSEYGIRKKVKDKIILTKYDSEEKFYEALGMDWIPPELREDTGEIEASMAHKLPKLVELKDIKSDFHLHSSYPIEPSHDMGASSMEEMLKRSKELGYEYIGFSEHNPSISNHTDQQICSILEKRAQKISLLNKSNKYIRVISLLETDILPSGKLAISNNALSFLDATIVSVHSSFGMSEKDMTKRVLDGLSHPKAKILAHPTGRLLNDRSGYNLDWEKVFDFVKKHNKALEINAWPNRLDLPDTLVKEAVKHKVKMVIDTDSHALSQMDVMKYGVAVARRGWATKDDILNTLSYNEFIAWLKR